MGQKDVRTKLLETKGRYLCLLMPLGKHKMCIMNWMIQLRKFPKKLKRMPSFLLLLTIKCKRTEIHYELKDRLLKEDRIWLFGKFSASSDSKIC